LAHVLYFVVKREKMNYVQYLATQKALTDCPSFPQAVFSSRFIPKSWESQIIDILHETGTRRVKVDVTNKFQEIDIFLEQNKIEPVLEKMAV
jgi:hypothetical protein